jgi:hypothetical protein
MRDVTSMGEPALDQQSKLMDLVGKLTLDCATALLAKPYPPIAITNPSIANKTINHTKPLLI